MSSRTTARPYRDFLTPALHRRFTSAFTLTICLCYAEAVWMGEWNNFFWPWFPLGFAGIRTGLLCIASMAIYVLRVSQMHIGERTTNYPFETFFKYLFRLNTIMTLFWYIVSTWLFVETYIWSQAPNAKLAFTDYGRTHERIRLNERPMFLRFMFFCLAVAQSTIHLYKDYDRVAFPVLKGQKKSNDTGDSSIMPRTQIWAKSKQIVSNSFIIMLFVLFGGSLLYFVFLRQAIWEWNYRFGRWIFSLAKTSRPSANPALAELWARFVVEGFLLALLWQFTNTAFDAYFAQEPLKKERPITDDSKDPNGSLLNGLKAKKEVPRNVAFWELVLITERFDTRRRSIYEEIDRKNGSTWKQVLAVCLAEIRGVSERIQAVQSPAPNPGAMKSEPFQTLPRISQPLKEDEVIGKNAPPSTRLDKLGNFASDFAKAHASPPGSSPPTQRLLEYSNTLLTPERKAQLSSGTLTGWLQTQLLLVIRSPIGTPFRKSLRRDAKLVVAGTPYGRAGMIADAASALTGLAVCSLKEDSLGQVYKDIPEIIRAFVTAIKQIEGFVSGIEVHWTDTDLKGKNEDEIRRIPETEELVEVLKSGLEKIVLAFVEYLEAMDIAKTEIVEAKELAQKDRKPADKEMIEKK